MSNIFEFQFKWGSERACFGFDVKAATIDEAVSYANIFLDDSDGIHNLLHSEGVDRIWIHVTSPATQKDIATIYGPIDAPGGCCNHTFKSFRKKYEIRCSLCKKQGAADTAHKHQNKFICDECWDERLKITE